MSTIGQRTFSDGVANYFTLGNEEFVRTFNFSNGWIRCRLGMLVALQGSSNFSATSPAFGICKGSSPIQNTKGIKSDATSQTTWFEGEAFGGYGFGGSSFTYNAGPPAYYHGPLNIVVWRQGALGNNAAWSQNFYIAAAGSGNRTFLVVDAYKVPAVGIEWTCWVPQAVGQAQVDYAMGDLMIACSQGPSQSLIIKGTAMTGLSPVNQPRTNEAAGGEMDTFNFFWSNTSPVIEVYGVCAFASYI